MKGNVLINQIMAPVTEQDNAPADLVPKTGPCPSYYTNQKNYFMLNLSTPSNRARPSSDDSVTEFKMNAGLIRPHLTAILVFAVVAYCFVVPQTLKADSNGELVQLFRPFPVHLNSAISDDLSVASAASNIFVSLLEIDENGGFEPYLAIWWNVSDDEKTVTFYLQAETVFHDGEPVTSRDVVFSFNAFREHHPMGERMLRNVMEVEAPDELTFIMRLSRPDPALFKCLAAPFMPILPAHIYGGADLAENPANFKAVGSGPFRVTTFNTDEVFVLERFDSFLRPGRPHLDRIIGMSGENPFFAVSALNNESAHLFTFVEHPDIINLLSESGHLMITSTGYEQIGAMNILAFNLRKKHLRNLKVRQAIAHAIDLEYIGAAIHQDFALSLNGPLPLNSPFQPGQCRLPTGSWRCGTDSG